MKARAIPYKWLGLYMGAAALAKDNNFAKLVRVLNNIAVVDGWWLANNQEGFLVFILQNSGTYGLVTVGA